MLEKGPTSWAARGATTPIRAAPATCRRRSTRSRSRRKPDWDRVVRRASRRSASTCATSPTRPRRRAARRASAPRCSRRRWDATRSAGDVDTTRGPTSPRGVLVGAGRSAARAVDPRPARARPLRRHRLPLRALEPRPRPRRRARRGRRHRRVGDPVRAGDPAARRAAAPLPAHRAVGAPEARPPDPGVEKAAVPAVPGRSSARGARCSTAASRRSSVAERAPARHARSSSGSACCTCAGAVRDPELRRDADAALHARLQAAAALELTGTRALPAAQRRGRPARAARGPRAVGRRRRRHRARGRHDHLRHRLPRHRPADRRRACAAPTAARWPRRGAATPRPTSARPSPASRTSFSLIGPEPRQRPHVGDRARRGAGPLPRRRARGDGARAARERRRPPRRPGRVERRGPGRA